MNRLASIATALALMGPFTGISAARAHDVNSLPPLPKIKTLNTPTVYEGDTAKIEYLTKTRRAMGLLESPLATPTGLAAACGSKTIHAIMGEGVGNFACDLREKLIQMDQADPLTHKIFGSTTRIEIMLGVSKPVMRRSIGYGKEELHNWAFLARSLGVRISAEQRQAVLESLTKKNDFDINVENPGHVLDILAAPETEENQLMESIILKDLLRTDYTNGLNADQTASLIEMARIQLPHKTEPAPQATPTPKAEPQAAPTEQPMRKWQTDTYEIPQPKAPAKAPDKADDWGYEIER